MPRTTKEHPEKTAKKEKSTTREAKGTRETREAKETKAKKTTAHKTTEAKKPATHHAKAHKTTTTHKKEAAPKGKTAETKKTKTKEAEHVKPTKEAKETKGVKGVKEAKKTKGTKTKKIAQPTDHFSDPQREELLGLMEQVVNTRKRKQGGVRSLARIDLILNRYNQKYRSLDEKFAAAVQSGLAADAHHKNQLFYVIEDARGSDEKALFDVLIGIGHGNLDFAQAKQKILAIITRA